MCTFHLQEKPNSSPWVHFILKYTYSIHHIAKSICTCISLPRRVEGSSGIYVHWKLIIFPKSVPLTFLPLNFVMFVIFYFCNNGSWSFILFYFPPRQWILWNVMSIVALTGIVSLLIIKSFVLFWGSSAVCSGLLSKILLVNPKLFLSLACFLLRMMKAVSWVW